MKLTAHTQDIINKYNSGDTTTQLAIEYGVAPQSINYQLRKAGVGLRPNHGHREYPINTGFFDDIDNELNAYWLGFALADGSLVNNRFIMGLSTKDIGHLELFKTDVGSGHPIKFRDSGLGRVCILDFSCKTWRTALGRLGWQEFKRGTSASILDKVPPDLVHHCVRGFFDGDGCITRTMTGRKQERVIKFCGQRPILRWLVSYLHTTHVIPTTEKSISPNQNGSLYVVKWSGNATARRFYDIIYRDAIRMLPRKEIRFREDSWLS